MKIDIQKLLEGPMDVDVELPGGFLAEGLETQGVSFDDGRGKMAFRIVGDDIMASGELRSCVRAKCARCLAPAQWPLRVEVHLYYLPEPKDRGPAVVDVDPAEADCGTYTGGWLEPDDDLRELLVVEAPSVLLCRDDCKGLCPRCGANLNSEACQCEADEDGEGDAAWKDNLKSLKLDDDAGA
jgi:uncharacterized protein